MSAQSFVLWSRCTSYGDLDRAAADTRDLAPDEFVRGPFAQFLHLAADPEEGRGVRARTMQFAKRRYNLFRARLTQSAALELDRLVSSRLEDLRVDPDQAWLIHVWDGRLGHHAV